MMNITLFLTLAELSKWIYLPSQHFEDFNIVYKYEGFSLLESETKCVTVFRGTDNIDDVFDDVLDFQAPFSCATNKNLLLFEDVLSKEGLVEILFHILRNCNEKQKYTTGHSLGGSRALYFDYISTIMGFAIDSTVVTFGEPASCCREHNLGISKHYRFINGNFYNYDPLTSIANRDHTHCSDGSLIFTENPYDFHRNSPFPTSLAKRFIHNLNKHHIQSYIDTLELNLWNTINYTSLFKNDKIIK